ncbi:Large-conductance mechanosensitive channel [Folsomia candida]|uniref:Large-conductance mechanosensitive channel n=1 Tax=Folsomia candida TaxID=158441 RepID=A0A226D6N8_FOLCA|nr:Large-conductance mechanosensitive channel [Folsomia candida]
MGLKEFFRDGSVIKGAAGFIIGNASIDVVAVFTSALVIPVFGIFGGIPEFKGNICDCWAGPISLYHPSFDLIRKYVISEDPPEVRDCPRCWVEINSKASKCPNCTADIEPLWVVGDDGQASTSKYAYQKKWDCHSPSNCGRSTTLCCSRIGHKSL